MVTAMKDTTLDSENVDREKSVDIRRPMVNPSTTNIPNTTTSSSSTNPCTLVRHSCFEFVKQDQCQKHVQINPDAIPILAQQILEKQQQQQQQQDDHHHHSAALLVEWDEENWHYSCQSSKQEPPKLSSNDRMVVVKDVVDTTTWPSTLRKERIAMYILALDAINFCFWKSQNDDTFTTTTTSMTNTEMMIHDYKYEYDDLAQTLTNMATADHMHQQQQVVVVVAQMQNSTTDETTLLSSEFLLSPMHLQNMTLDRMIQLFQTYHPKNYQTMSNTNTDQVDSTPAAASAAVSYVPPYMLERCQIWNEIGTVLMNPPFHGSILPLFEMVEEKCHQQQQQSTSASSSKASILVQLLIEHFPNFRDDTKQRYHDEMSKQQLETCSNSEISPSESSSLITAGTPPPPPPPPPLLYFYKRAQICVGDLHAALAGANLQTDDNDASNHMDDITTFADYRVPQLLRHYHIIQYSTKLAQQIDTYEVLVQHSEEEYAIRASTIVVVELLVQELRRQHEPALLQETASNDGIDIHSHHPSMIGTATTNSSCSTRWNAMQTDWYLWKLGEKMEHKNELQPHHRVRTTFY